MVKYLELCVELRNSYVAKEGIYQYKIICQQTQIKSFEDVVRKYLELAEAKAEAAKEKAQASILDVDDLDNLQTPESILLSAVSSEVSQDRTDRVLLLPWVKFLWESYRQCLDLLKNNARTERLYHDIAHKAFEFCQKFNRKTEFRKLCDNLHAHLDLLKKQQQQLTQQQSTHNLQNIINLSNPESQALHLETRLQQLDCAIAMELWQEAYKATDDIKRFNLMNLTKKPPKPHLMASYFLKLALVFQKANCPLFHAAALFRHFLLTKEMKKIVKEDEVQKMSSKVVVATLSIPIPPTRPEIDKLVDTDENVVENHHRNLASLLGLTQAVPSRSSMIRDLKRMGVLNYAYPALQHLYSFLEVDFDPLLLCSRVADVLAFIDKCDSAPDLKQYVTPLKEVSIIRLLKEVAQVYSTVEFKRLLDLCPFTDSIQLETFVVSAARRNDLQVRIDHRQKCLHFGTGLNSNAEEVIDGPHLQSMPSAEIRQQLVNMYSVLQKARVLIEPEQIKARREKLKHQIIVTFERNRNKDHQEILARQSYIEQRKEELELITLQREEEKRKIEDDYKLKLRKEEAERIRRENEERENQKKQLDEQDLKRRMAKDQIDTMRLTEAGQKVLESMGEDELNDLKVEEIRAKQWEQLEKERKEQIQKQQKLERKTDYLERAKRLEELPLLLEQFEKEKVKNREIFEEMEIQRIEEIQAEHQLALEHRDRLLRMQGSAAAFALKIREARTSEYQKKLRDWEQQVEKLKQTRLVERREKRKEEKRMKYKKEKLEKEKALREAEELIRKEEERKIQEEARRKLDEQAQRMREREEEVERKQRERDEASQRTREDKNEDRFQKPRAPEPQQEERNWRQDRPQMQQREIQTRDRERDDQNIRKAPDHAPPPPEDEGDWRKVDRRSQNPPPANKENRGAWRNEGGKNDDRPVRDNRTESGNKDFRGEGREPRNDGGRDGRSDDRYQRPRQDNQDRYRKPNQDNREDQWRSDTRGDHDSDPRNNRRPQPERRAEPEGPWRRPQQQPQSASGNQGSWRK